MKKSNQDRKGLDEYAAFLVRHKTLKLAVVDHRLSREFSDVEQDLATELLHRMKYYDPAISKKTTYIEMILRNGICDLYAHRRAKARDYRKTVHSLNETIPGDEGDGSMERLDLLTAGDIPHRRSDAEETTLTELRLDMGRLLSGLCEEERELCELLKTHTMSDASRKLGIPRTTLYDRLKKIKRVFRRAGMEVYLK